MENDEFVLLATTTVPVRTTLNNPKKGTTEIIRYNFGNLCYRRKNSLMYVNLTHFAEAYNNFQGRPVSTTDLRNYKPNVFDSRHNGHSCNCTVFFLFLKEMGLTDIIEGNGVKNDPFRVEIKGEQI